MEWLGELTHSPNMSDGALDWTSREGCNWLIARTHQTCPMVHWMGCLERVAIGSLVACTHQLYMVSNKTLQKTHRIVKHLVSKQVIRNFTRCV